MTVFGLPLEFIRLDAGVETSTVTLTLDAAVELGETYTNRVFRITSFTGLFPCLTVDHSMSIRRPFIEIGRSPLIDVQELRIFEEGNVTATVVLPDIVRNPSYSRVFLPKGLNVTLDPDRLYPIEVDFRAGYSEGTPTFPQLPIPAAISAALKQHVAYLFENRGDVKGDFADAIPNDVTRSYAAVKIPLGGG